MSTVCDECGFKSNEIKTGGAISKQGKRISLLLTPESDDLSRDILKVKYIFVYFFPFSFLLLV